MIRKDKQFILNFTAVLGVGLTMISAIKDTNKANKLIKENMTTLERVKKTWKCYIPSSIIATSTILCIIYSDKVTINEKIALMNALTTIQNNHKELKDNIKTTCDDKTKDEILKKSICKKIPKDIYLERTEEKYFYEEYLGDFFITTIDNVLKAEYLLNKQLFITGSASLNDFYKYLGLTEQNTGHHIGWAIDRGCYDMGESNSTVSFINREIEDNSGLQFNYIGYNNEPYVISKELF